MSDASRILERLRLQEAKYREMVVLVAGQRPLFASMDVDGILGLIEQKRRLLSEIDAVDAELAPLKGNWARVRSEFTPGEAAAIEATLGGIQQVLGELMRHEDEGRALLDQRREEKTEALDGLLSKSRARGAYGSR
jgi:hypothetical protein